MITNRFDEMSTGYTTTEILQNIRIALKDRDLSMGKPEISFIFLSGAEVCRRAQVTIDYVTEDRAKRDAAYLASAEAHMKKPRFFFFKQDQNPTPEAVEEYARDHDDSWFPSYPSRYASETWRRAHFLLRAAKGQSHNMIVSVNDFNMILSGYGQQDE